jgi:oligopeptide/dipeptide ABC transporter ATP-binding protein
MNSSLLQHDLREAAVDTVPQPAPGSDVVLSVRELSIAFPREHAPDLLAVKNLSLDIRAGEFVGLMGDPGCGKSTAAIGIMGLVRPPGRIVAGGVSLMGRDLLTLGADQKAAIRGKDIGIIVQNPRTSLHPMLRVGVQIANVYLSHNQVSRTEAAARAIEMLKLVGINDPERRARAYPHELSTGMTQRVLIAMALSSRPRLLIADEPTSGLDVTIQAQFLDQMWEAAQATGSAVLLITQQIGIVANYCDRLLMMKDGEITEQGDTRSLLRRFAPAADETSAHDRTTTITGAEALVEVIGLSKQFAVRGSTAKVHAADNISFVIRAGECLGLVGESGSGKTTTGRCLLRLEEPSSGDIIFKGESIVHLDPHAMRQLRAKMQIVFQDPFDSMNPRWTVQQVIGELLDLHTDLAAADKQAGIDALLALVGLPAEVKFAAPRALSAGPQQRVAIARALATNPEFLVLDEPTSALTAETTKDLIALLRQLSADLGLAMLFISHDLTTIGSICHRVGVMYLGQIVEIGSRGSVFDAPRHPYSKALLAAHLFPDIDHRRVDRTDRPSLKGEIPSPIDLPKGCYLFGRCPEQLERCRDQPQKLEKLRDGTSVRCWRVSEADKAAA